MMNENFKRKCKDKPKHSVISLIIPAVTSHDKPQYTTSEIRAVSYTHLDVYKSQSSSSSTFMLHHLCIPEVSVAVLSLIHI